MAERLKRRNIANPNLEGGKDKGETGLSLAHPTRLNPQPTQVTTLKGDRPGLRRQINARQGLSLRNPRANHHTPIPKPETPSSALPNTVLFSICASSHLNLEPRFGVILCAGAMLHKNPRMQCFTYARYTKFHFSLKVLLTRLAYKLKLYKLISIFCGVIAN